MSVEHEKVRRITNNRHIFDLAGRNNPSRFITIQKKIQRFLEKHLDLKIGRAGSTTNLTLLNRPSEGGLRSNAHQIFNLILNSIKELHQNPIPGLDPISIVMEFDHHYRDWSVKSSVGQLSYNNALGLYMFLKVTRPKVIVESGVWKGFTTYIMNKALSHDCQIHSYDINLGEIEYKAANVAHVEGDFTMDRNLDWSGVDFVYLDDHVSHYDRLEYLNERQVKYIALDDDVSLATLHNDNYPPLPSFKFLLDYGDVPEQVCWFVDGGEFQFRKPELDLSFLSNYFYTFMPNLFQSTGYYNQSELTFLRRVTV